MSYRGATLRLAHHNFSISTEDVFFPPELDYGENEEFLKFFVLAYVKFLDDSPLFSTYGPKPLKTYKSWLKNLTTCDLRALLPKLSRLSDQILSTCWVTGAGSSTGSFVEEMIDTPVFKEYHLFFKTGRADLLKFVISFLRFGKKLDYHDSKLSQVAFRSWTDTEERLRTLTLPKHELEQLREIVHGLVGTLQVDQLWPKFGPGKVSESEIQDVFDKLNGLSSHPRITYAFHRPRPGRSEDGGFVPQSWDRSSSERSIDVGRLKFVPKDITKSRSICMEPNLFMYYQQEVQRWMRRSMAAAPISRYVCIEDQRPSQIAAVHGSKYLCTDTIDLSSASDSVHIDLVKGVFPLDWLFYMLATRTSKVLTPNGDTVRVSKFAPMGSAVCFPTQCIIFASICVYGALLVRQELDGWDNRLYKADEVPKLLDRLFHTGRSGETPYSYLFEPPVVYGDDIAVDSRTTSSVKSLLEKFGFLVNEEKSFCGSQAVRESCGVFAYQGSEVTPVLFHVPFFKGKEWDAKLYASIIGAANEFGDSGYRQVSKFLIGALKDYGFRYPVPFSSRREDFGIYSKNPHRPPKESLIWNADWQSYERLVQGIGPRRSRKEPALFVEDYRLGLWWRGKVEGSIPSLDFKKRSSSIRPQETRLVPARVRYEVD